MAGSTARKDKEHGDLDNADSGNLRILRAELKNLELGQAAWTAKEKRRHDEVVKKIAELVAKKEEGGNPRDEKRPHKTRPWR